MFHHSKGYRNIGSFSFFIAGDEISFLGHEWWLPALNSLISLIADIPRNTNFECRQSFECLPSFRGTFFECRQSLESSSSVSLNVGNRSNIPISLRGMFFECRQSEECRQRMKWRNSLPRILNYSISSAGDCREYWNLQWAIATNIEIFNV